MQIKSALLVALGLIFVVVSAEAQDKSPTFSGEVAAIVHKQCVSCHRPEGGAPFSLITFEEVRNRARMMVEVTQNGSMPPWKMAHSDLKFTNERHMSAEEKAELAAWVEGGMPLGDAAAVPAAPVFPSEWVHGVPDLVLEMEEEMPIPAEGTDLYRAFVVKIPDLPAGKYLKGLEYKPRAINTAHHTLFSIDSTGAARQLSEAQPIPGFRGGGGGGAGGGSMGRIAGWAVGAVPALFPEGTSIEIPHGSDLVLTSHFHPTGKPEVERSRIALYLTDEAPTRNLITVDSPFMFGALKDIKIPAGEANYHVREQFVVPTDVVLASIAPHAHYLAKTMDMTATFPDGRKMNFVSIKDWDFAWQEQYELAEEMALPKGTVLDMDFVFDNSATNPHNPTSPPKEVLWGLQSTDEMASMALGIITPTVEARAEFRKQYMAYVKQGIEAADPRIALASFTAMSRDRFDLNGDNEVSWGETFQAIGGIYDRWSKSRATNAAAAKAGPGSKVDTDPRAQILPVVFKRVFWVVILPWLLPRLVVLVLAVWGLVYLLRRWRASRRRRGGAAIGGAAAEGV